MPKLRDKVTAVSQAGPQRFLSAKQLFEFELESFSKMQTLRWPTKLAAWRNEIADAKRKADEQSYLDVHVFFEALNPRARRSTDAPHHIDLGARIIFGKPSEVTYFFAIGEKDGLENRKLLRKIHFDLDESVNQAEPKPALHLQVAGGMSPPMVKRGYTKESFDHLIPELEKPRVTCLPQTFALLVHMALLEYHCTEYTYREFMHSQGWLSIVSRAESMVWKPYFDHASTWLSATANRSSSLLSSFYGLRET